MRIKRFELCRVPDKGYYFREFFLARIPKGGLAKKADSRPDELWIVVPSCDPLDF
jgi:hypothetical protein